MAAAMPVQLPSGYSFHVGHPTIPAYRYLREASGLSPVTVAQATGAVSGSWYGCYIQYSQPETSASEPIAVAMGRIIGDGGWYFHIADMAVLPDHQRKGLGRIILRDLLAYIKANAAEGKPYISLFADPPGRSLYKKNGFVESSGLDEMGMVYTGTDSE